MQCFVDFRLGLWSLISGTPEIKVFSALCQENEFDNLSFSYATSNTQENAHLENESRRYGKEVAYHAA